MFVYLQYNNTTKVAKVMTNQNKVLGNTLSSEQFANILINVEGVFFEDEVDMGEFGKEDIEGEIFAECNVTFLVNIFGMCDKEGEHSITEFCLHDVKVEDEEGNLYEFDEEQHLQLEKAIKENTNYYLN